MKWMLHRSTRLDDLRCGIYRPHVDVGRSESAQCEAALWATLRPHVPSVKVVQDDPTLSELMALRGL